uniref:SMC_N domain-containing protein n=1 Tax=Panagrellus redivivus TaxID=6233 RepID=A0A7E4WCG4_PANRE
MADDTVDASMLDLTADPAPNDENQMSLTRVIRTTQVEEVGITAGRILEIDLENFMCHKNLKMRFDADQYNCFYIVGPNGSGKSAIFAGLNIGLGGKGRSNDRGNSLNAYIKEGETTCRIRIHLSNVGDNAHPDYGKEIIVERIINQSSSRYSLKSLDNRVERVVSTNKKDLDRLLSRFCIELENPLCWLSQDRARQFLHQMKPDKLYEIFMITSELILVNRRYETTTNSLKNLNMLLTKWKEQQKAKKANYEELKRILKAIENLEIAEHHYKQLKWWTLWLPIKEAQAKLRDAAIKYEKSKQSHEELKLKLDNRKEEARELEEDKTAKQMERAKIQSKSGQLTMQKKALIAKNREMHDKVNDIDRKITGIKKDIRSAESEVRHHEKALVELMGGVDRDIVGERAELQIQIDQYRHQEQSDSTQLSMLNARKQTILAERDRAYQTVREAQNEARALDADIKNVQREKEQAAKVAIDMMARFGPDTTKILEVLKINAHRFGKMPIGPIGRYIHVKDRRFVDPIEKVLQFDLGNYIVESPNDRRTFEQVIKHYNLRCDGIVVSKFSDYKIDTSRRAPSHDVLTIERVLEISDPTVFNYLIDSDHIETLMLIETDAEARDIMRNRPPQNVTKAYTATASEVMPARHGSYYRFYTNNYKARILTEVMSSHNNQADLDNRIAHLEAQKADANNKAVELKRETGKFADSIKEVDEEISALQKRMYRNEQQIKTVEAKMEQLETIVTRQTAIDNCRTALDENKKQLEVCRARIAELEVTKDTILMEIRQNQVEIDDKQAETNTVCQQVTEMDAIIAEVSTQISKFEIQTAEFARRFQFLEKNLVKHLAAQEAAQEALTEAEQKLETRDPDDTEIPDGASDPPDMDNVPEPDFILPKISAAKRKLTEYRARINGVHVSKTEVVEAKKAFLDASEKVEQQEKECAAFQESFERREALFNDVKRNLPAQLRKKFREFMSMRNYVGDLVVDHENARIEITVQTHKGAKPEDVSESESSDDEADISMDATPTKRSRRVREKKQKVKRELKESKEKGEGKNGKDKAKTLVQDLKGLSGGERSYTTACFVMALWSCVECPFRCLDEFDVFMDMINRRVVMELLSELARKHRHIQFFFFTPQGIQELDCGDVEVFTMNKVR